MVDPEEVGLSAAKLARIEAWAQRLVDDGKLPGVITLVTRRDQVAHLHVCGHADIARGVKLATDSIFRIYSMTKPLATVAAMMLYKEGRFHSTTRSHGSCPASLTCASIPAAAAGSSTPCRPNATSRSAT